MKKIVKELAKMILNQSEEWVKDRFLFEVGLGALYMTSTITQRDKDFLVRLYECLEEMSDKDRCTVTSSGVLICCINEDSLIREYKVIPY